LGKTGDSVLRYLSQTGTRVHATDSDPARAALAGDAWRTQNEAMAGLAETDLVVVSPGVPLGSELIAEARQRGIEIVGDIELFARAISLAPSPQPPVPSVCAITGTNGKSTVASLVAAMATAAGKRVAAGANLGTPALDLIAPEVEFYVLELSSFQLELTDSLAPTAAAVLNVSADHLDRYATLEAYATAKARIYARAGTAVANRDDPLVTKMVRERDGVVSFGLGEPKQGEYGLREEKGGIFLSRGEKHLLAVGEVPLAGRHNLANVLAAWALGAALGLDDAAMAAAVREFHSLPHRLAAVGVHRGVTYLDDSKATNVAAACAALAGLSRPLVAIAGGVGKGQNFAPFADCLVERARAVILLGAAAEEIEAAVTGHVPIVRARAMPEAVGLAAAMAKAGDRVVLAPACASQDMFSDYNARGEAFAAAVEALNDD
jgi:UDP-N-acetylmuramoylalanine--D-glutamate ligase